jgi:Tfp pilus assembly protein PilV
VKSPSSHLTWKTRAFLLLESILAVAIFSVAVLALGQCMQQCLRAESMKEDDARGRRLLENRMIEIEAGEEPLGDAKTEDLKGAYAGMTLRTTSVQVKDTNEDGKDIVGIYDVVLEIAWSGSSGKQSKTLEFYVYPKQK